VFVLITSMHGNSLYFISLKVRPGMYVCMVGSTLLITQPLLLTLLFQSKKSVHEH